MSIVFNADEIFEIAEDIERNGAAFYRRAAEAVAEENSSEGKLFLELAEREDDHEKFFKALRAELTQKEMDSTTFDPDDEGSKYLKAMADGHIFDTRQDPSKLFETQPSMGDILRVAIECEKDSVVFYAGMKRLVPDELGKAKLDGIIDEEVRHVMDLTGLLRVFGEK
ncbi:ferritin family protein [Candidatus Hydrogenedentota bacterium]